MSDDPRITNSRNIQTRLILEKILGSDAIRHMRKEDVQRLNFSFISRYPGDNSYIFYFYVFNGELFRKNSNVAHLYFSWEPVCEKEKDKEGNLWTTYELVMSVTIRESSLSEEELKEWISCLNHVNDLVFELRSSDFSKSIREMTHNNEERISLEKEVSRKNAKFAFQRYFMNSKEKKFLSSLRVGGNSKKILTSTIKKLIGDCEDDVIEFSIKENWPRLSQKARLYVAVISRDSNYSQLYRKL